MYYFKATEEMLLLIKQFASPWVEEVVVPGDLQFTGNGRMIDKDTNDSVHQVAKLG